MNRVIQKQLPAFCFPGRKIRELRMLVIHYFSGRWQFPDDPFNMQKCWDLFVDLNLPPDQRKHYPMPDLKKRSYASAQYLIGRDALNETWSLVPDNLVAWHAGESEWVIDGERVTNLNEWSIGFELVNDGKTPYTNAQYKMLAHLCAPYDVPVMLMRGHNEISPGRKHDPGELFDWPFFQALVESARNGRSLF